MFIIRPQGWMDGKNKGRFFFNLLSVIDFHVCVPVNNVISLKVFYLVRDFTLLSP